jgi:hypothetical protein
MYHHGGPETLTIVIIFGLAALLIIVAMLANPPQEKSDSPVTDKTYRWSSLCLNCYHQNTGYQEVGTPRPKTYTCCQCGTEQRT